MKPTKIAFHLSAIFSHSSRRRIRTGCFAARRRISSFRIPENIADPPGLSGDVFQCLRSFSVHRPFSIAWTGGDFLVNYEELGLLSRSGHLPHAVEKTRRYCIKLIQRKLVPESMLPLAGW